MLSSLDDGVGRILASLRAANIEEDTLVVFFSDNGGAPATGSNGPLRGAKSTTSEGGVRVPFIFRLPGKIPAGATR